MCPQAQSQWKFCTLISVCLNPIQICHREWEAREGQGEMDREWEQGERGSGSKGQEVTYRRGIFKEWDRFRECDLGRYGQGVWFRERGREGQGERHGQGWESGCNEVSGMRDRESMTGIAGQGKRKTNESKGERHWVKTHVTHASLKCQDSLGTCITLCVHECAPGSHCVCTSVHLDHTVCARVCTWITLCVHECAPGSHCVCTVCTWITLCVHECAPGSHCVCMSVHLDHTVCARVC